MQECVLVVGQLISSLGVVEKSLLSPGRFLYGFDMAGKACCDERQKTKHYGVSSDCLTAIEPILPLMINVGASISQNGQHHFACYCNRPQISGAENMLSQSFSQSFSPLDAGRSQESKVFSGSNLK